MKLQGKEYIYKFLDTGYSVCPKKLSTRRENNIFLNARKFHMDISYLYFKFQITYFSPLSFI